MLCVTFTALVQILVGCVKAYAAGTATFLMQGLQLILAILLITLGVVIVVNSLRAYAASKKGGEKATAQ